MRRHEQDRPVVIVVGADDVGSAVAHALHRAGAAVVLVDDIDPPWARRGMSYVDAWYVGGATLEQVDACFCGSVKSLPAVLARGDMIAATTWSWAGVAAALAARAVVETRPGCRMSPARSRPPRLDGVVTVGVRTAQVGGWPADVVIAGLERDFGAPMVAANRLDRSATATLGIDAPHSGRFRTRHQIAERVETGDLLGELGTFAAIAPASGILVALAARGARVATGHTLVEIDPAGDVLRCFGLAPDARALAQRVVAAVRKATQTAFPSGPPVPREPRVVSA